MEKGGFGLGRSEMDITKHRSVCDALDRFRPRTVINSAAQANVNLADMERERSFMVNGDGVEILARECGRRGIRLVHISTDYVLDDPGVKWLTEDLETRPRSSYAESKLVGERAALALGATVCLAPWNHTLQQLRTSDGNGSTSSSPEGP